MGKVVAVTRDFLGRFLWTGLGAGAWLLMREPLTDFQLAYVLGRVALGVNFLLHGIVRLPKLGGFVTQMQETFAESLVPNILVVPMAWLIPVVELVLGLFLILGLWTRSALVGSAGLMLVLISGCCLIENWSAVGSQMLYMLIICLLVAWRRENRLVLVGS